MNIVTWTIKDIVNILIKRQQNKFDGNMAISGDRGNGKTTVASKIFFRFKKYNPWKHQVYAREDIINLLKYNKFSFCMDDEAINSGYKRDFQNKAQQELIKFLTAYRDHFNIFSSAIPNFFSLDRDFRDLYFLHLHVIERGIAVVHMPLQGRLYSLDRWDAKYNAKIEENWSKKIQKDSTFKPRYHRLTTFKGYLYFNDLTPKQRELVETVKTTKRSDSFLTKKERLESGSLSFIQKTYETLINKKLTKEGLIQACLIEGRKYSVITSTLNRMLTDNGETRTMREFLQQQDKQNIHNSIQDQINDIIPSI